MRPLFRVEPAMPAASYKTYAIDSPLMSHFRPGTCEEAQCQAFAKGWRSTFDETTELGQKQAHYVRKLSGRKFGEHRDEAGLTVFAFEAGQACFRSPHQVSLERPANFLVLGGDHRGNPRGEPARVHKPDDWVDDFAEHQQKLADRLQQG